MGSPLRLLALFALLLSTNVCADQDEDIPHNEVKNWALKFGVDLWEFGRHFSKMNQIQNKYHDWDLDVVRKDGLLLLREMTMEVKNLMDFKMSAVMRIMDSAEQAALSGGRSGAEPPSYLDARRLNVFAPDGRLADGARRLQLTPSRHFDHLSVNTTRSAILMPPYVDEYDSEVQNQIAWSEHLDPLFANNYESDAALSWQYFGSSAGFLRRYPAISWPPEDGRSHHARDLYDFRSASWFVEAATSPKDVVILLDWSSAATGAKGSLARATAAAILDTLTSNDFVNIYRFNDVTEELVPCFKNMLVQATPENIRELKYALDSNTPEPSNEANFTAALTVAFEILHRYNRTGLGCQCNQAAMLIAGGATSAPREVFRTHNWPHMPVRVFTYLAGSDASGAAHMQWIACSNKGFYARINDYREIREKVFNYVSVMARPMVMYQADHPIQWSPAYIGGRGSGFADDGLGQLMTSVTIPIFDRRNHTQREANLLGVVGTDVPIDQIKKLIPSYRLGVNGYSFIVNNNGHVLYHPDLRPLYNNEEYSETLRPLYSNIDVTELELSEHEATPRENHSLLMDLRNEMVDQKEGETEIAIKIHYEDMRRVSTRRQRYFYGPIDGTPFSLAIVLPDGYGMYEVLADQEIRHSPINVTDYFKGENWRVHPDWVYCEYNSASDVVFQTPEERIVHFLARAGRPGWKWMSLRPRSPTRENSHHHFKKQEKDSYFCDKNLVQSLVRDAMVMEGLDVRSSHTGHKQQGYQMFGVTLSFIATRSGLLKWTEHVPKAPDSSELHFSEIYQRAFDAPWYKRAVDHHAVEPESFVFSVPFREPGSNEGTDPLVLATHAIFVEHRGHRAPVAVVGLHFQLHTLAKHFHNITSTCTGSGNCKKNCASQDLDCYILDDNGFVILSEESSHTGQFFGQIDGTIMDSLVQDRIYRKVPLFDYQGRCPNGKNPYSARANQHTPIEPFRLLLAWITRVVGIWFPLWESVNGHAHSYAQDDASYPTYGDYDDTEEQESYSPVDEIPQIGVGVGATTTGPWVIVPPGPASMPGNPGISSTGPAIPAGPIAPPLPPGAAAGVRSCDKRTDLYVLQADRLNMSQPLKGKLTNCHVTGCERPFSVQKIPHSNLILLVVDTLCPCGVKQLGTGARELTPTGPCRIPSSPFRRRPHKCINYHPEEIEIQLCGKSNTLLVPIWLLVKAVMITVIIT